MFQFITHRPFWVNLLSVVVITALMIIIFLQLLGWITNHGKYLTVPSVVNQKTDKAVKWLESKGFEVVIQDSVYTDTAARGIVLKQLPDPGATVKVNRTVYLTVNRVTLPLVDMPALEGKPLSFAITILKRCHLQLGDTIYRADFTKGAVLEQQFDGNRVSSGTKVPWGSNIDLVIGSGLNDERIPVPAIIGLTFAEAKIVLEENGIGLGAVIADADVKDTLAGFIYQQSPTKLTEDNQLNFIRSGQLMDVWISSIQKITDSIK